MLAASAHRAVDRHVGDAAGVKKRVAISSAAQLRWNAWGLAYGILAVLAAPFIALLVLFLGGYKSVRDWASSS